MTTNLLQQNGIQVFNQYQAGELLQMLFNQVTTDVRD